MQEIRDDVKAIRADVTEIKTVLAVNTESLKHHVKRTELAEERIGRVETWTLGLLTAILLAVIGAVVKTLSG